MVVNIFQTVSNFLFARGANSVIKNWGENPLPFKDRFSQKPVRISISYLHRITIKDEIHRTWFLLVKNKRTPMFQPPGGVYKYYSKKPLISIRAKDSKFFHEEGDLRLNLPRKNIHRFLRLFNNESWREVGFYREFKEELLDNGILPTKIFGTPEFRLLGRKNSGLRFSDHFQCDEIIFYDIIDVDLNEEQKGFLKDLRKRPFDEQFIFATEESIIRHGFHPNKNGDPIRIAEHTKRIL